MTDRDPASYPYEPPGLRALLATISYKPGWRFFLEEWKGDEPDERGNYASGWRLVIVSNYPDSLDPEFKKPMPVGHIFIVPGASYKRDVWAAWVRDRLSDVEGIHELGEFLRFSGVREFAPHHAKGEDPYLVWHVSDYATADKQQGDE